MHACRSTLEDPTALVIAGDLYDGDQTSMKTARFLADQLRRLDEAGVRSFIVRGNHDAESRITRELTLPDSATVFAGRAETVEVAAGALDVALHGISFAQRHAPESLLTRFHAPRAGALNIGILHTNLNGSPAHDLYAPCSSADLHAAGFDYWALGHVHERSVERGRATIVMPGNPQGRDINEPGPKSATLVTARDDRSLLVEERLTGIAEFRRAAVDCAGVEDWRSAVRRMASGLEAAREDSSCEHVVVRLRLEGATPMAWALRADSDRVDEEARALAASVGRTWIDKVEIRCADPAVEAGAGDPVAELAVLMAGEVAHSQAIMDELHSFAEALRGQLPADARDDLFGRDAAAFAKILRRFADDGAGDVLARLRAAALDRAA